MLRNISLVFLFLGGSVAGVGAVAAPLKTQSLDSIQQAARQYILERGVDYPSPPTVEADPLDSRLRLAECSQPLETFSPSATERPFGKVTVGVRCTGQNPWSLFVPVTVSVMAPVVVAARDLARGDLIAAEDLRLETRDLSRLHRGYLERPDDAVGNRVRQHIRRDDVITPSRISVPLAVKRNSRVVIVASNPAIAVHMAGTALDSGGIGDRIRVRNRSSQRELEATIISQGVVQVAM
jgi:flagella basal body P-ring formation protein FlgA